jgi:hypothetical protein
MLYEIQLRDRFFYAKGRTAEAAAAKVQATFGDRWSRAFPTGRTKNRGAADC